MTDPPEALVYPVAGLLAEPPGTFRSYDIGPVRLDLGEDMALAEPATGDLELSRTNRGLLVRAHLHAALDETCSRCLREIQVPLDVEIDEEVLPSVELTTGLPVDMSQEPDVMRLDERHELDLEPLVREAIQLAEPIAPLCREDCPGLCPICGQELSSGPHDHPDEPVDPRLEGLRSFRVDGEPPTG
ncbi:MAG TPA: DUF177 domain-containing protein [Candidatus Dormibacteraeota bacterium]|nr:DUF177 domain-containing protein [Candidatus Dormibacteraeota bacterium]